MDRPDGGVPERQRVNGAVNKAWPAAPAAAPRFRWYHRAAALLYIFFCFEVGVFLLLFPWLELWDHNYFAALGQEWRHVWSSPYVRGAVSGLGLVNIWISFSELFRLRRFSSQAGGRGPIE